MLYEMIYVGLINRVCVDQFYVDNVIFFEFFHGCVYGWFSVNSAAFYEFFDGAGDTYTGAKLFYFTSVVGDFGSALFWDLVVCDGCASFWF